MYYKHRNILILLFLENTTILLINSAIVRALYSESFVIQKPCDQNDTGSYFRQEEVPRN